MSGGKHAAMASSVERESGFLANFFESVSKFAYDKAKDLSVSMYQIGNKYNGVKFYLKFRSYYFLEKFYYIESSCPNNFIFRNAVVVHYRKKSGTLCQRVNQAAHGVQCLAVLFSLHWQRRHTALSSFSVSAKTSGRKYLGEKM